MEQKFGKITVETCEADGVEILISYTNQNLSIT